MNWQRAEVVGGEEVLGWAPCVLRAGRVGAGSHLYFSSFVFFVRRAGWSEYGNLASGC